MVLAQALTGLQSLQSSQSSSGASKLIPVVDSRLIGLRSSLVFGWKPQFLVMKTLLRTAYNIAACFSQGKRARMNEHA